MVCARQQSHAAQAVKTHGHTPLVAATGWLVRVIVVIHHHGPSPSTPEILQENGVKNWKSLLVMISCGEDLQVCEMAEYQQQKYGFPGSHLPGVDQADSLIFVDPLVEMALLHCCIPIISVENLLFVHCFWRDHFSVADEDS